MKKMAVSTRQPARAMATLSAGFTLIELLVVMVLLGLVVSIAVTTVGAGNQSTELRNEAQRLHAVLRMAAEEAVFNNVEIGLYLDTDHYEFLLYDEPSQKWQAATQTFLRRKDLPEWLLIDYQRADSDRKFEPKKRDEQDLTESEEDIKTPSLMLFSSGEVTPFTIAMEINDNPALRVEVIADDEANITIEGLGAEQ